MFYMPIISIVYCQCTFCYPMNIQGCTVYTCTNLQTNEHKIFRIDVHWLGKPTQKNQLLGRKTGRQSNILNIEYLCY